MTDLESAREGRRDLDGVLAGYEDPWTLLVETVPQRLYVVSVAATVAAGLFVGGFASGQSSWPPALAAAAVASLLAFINLASPANWFRAGAVAVTLWASGFLVMRWRRRRRSAAGAA